MRWRGGEPGGANRRKRRRGAALPFGQGTVAALLQTVPRQAGASGTEQVGRGRERRGRGGGSERKESWMGLKKRDRRQSLFRSLCHRSGDAEVSHQPQRREGGDRKKRGRGRGSGRSRGETKKPFFLSFFRLAYVGQRQHGASGEEHERSVQRMSQHAAASVRQEEGEREPGECGSMAREWQPLPLPLLPFLRASFPLLRR